MKKSTDLFYLGIAHGMIVVAALAIPIFVLNTLGMILGEVLYPIFAIVWIGIHRFFLHNWLDRNKGAILSAFGRTEQEKDEIWEMMAEVDAEDGEEE